MLLQKLLISYWCKILRWLQLNNIILAGIGKISLTAKFCINNCSLYAIHYTRNRRRTTIVVAYTLPYPYYEEGDGGSDDGTQ